MEQNNTYIKQFPDLMQGKRILYVHGFGSSAQSGTVLRIRQTFPQADVAAFDLPVRPHEAMALLREKCRELQPHLIIGTSMGGMYAEQLRGYDRILINPAFEIADTMREHNLMGKQAFFSPRQDGVQEFYVDKPLVKEYREVSEQCFTQDGQPTDIPADQARVWGLFGDRDPLVHTFDLFRRHYTQAVRFHGEHRMDDRSFMHGVVPVIRWIDDRQEHRQRPIVFIAFEAMHDDYGKPVSSLSKAVAQLIEHYQVYFFAPCPTNDHAALDGVQQWLEEHIAVPAYDHVVFTNQPHLLYGDYFVLRSQGGREARSQEVGETRSQDESRDFMGAVIDFGSDEFKTWEDIMTYFSRLGGQ